MPSPSSELGFHHASFKPPTELYKMEDGLVLNHPLVKATFRLGAEIHAVHATNGTLLSDQMVSFKEESMLVLKEFITKHNAPAEVPDEALEGSDDDDDGEIAVKPPVKKRK